MAVINMGRMGGYVISYPLYTGYIHKFIKMGRREFQLGGWRTWETPLSILEAQLPPNKGDPSRVGEINRTVQNWSITRFQYFFSPTRFVSLQKSSVLDSSALLEPTDSWPEYLNRFAQRKAPNLQGFSQTLSPMWSALSLKRSRTTDLKNTWNLLYKMLNRYLSGMA